ncbi:DUF3426 domain-containing protein [Desulfobacter vibrioformis]|uniref:DUF3426 domain-containing protein n=1 Tax=Desulfobacter vibrioformis TaxID=34031 RepID=UPI0005534406|nr:DUF3426 domain-containing protein [Desulfobacter vibrioformis]
MIITCQACSTRFVLDDALIKPGGSKVRCSICRHVFTAFPEKSPEAPQAVEIPDPPEFEDQDILFDAPEIQDDSGVNVSQDDDFSINSGSDSLDPDLEETDIDFLEIEFDEPEFKQDPSERGTNTDAPDSQNQGIEIEDPAQGSDEDDLGLETADFKIDDPEVDFQGFEFDDDPQADLIIEDDGRDLSPETEDALIDVSAEEQEEIIGEQPAISIDDDNEKNDDQKADSGFEQTVSDQDKFAEYDAVLDQETEPEDANITIPNPEVENNTSALEIPLLPTDDEIKTPTEALIDPNPLITPPAAQSVRQKRSTKKQKGITLPVKILLVLFLLILAAYVAIIRLGVTIPAVSGIQIPFITKWLEPKPAPQPPLPPVPDEPSINGRFVSNKSAGELFIVTGRIKNPSNTSVSYIQVKGTLMTKDNTKAGTLTAYCGNIIPEETLKSGNISDITKQMEVRQGNQNTNVNIKPGTTVMFMLVFSNLPEDLSNFTVAVHGFEPDEK